MGLDEKFQYILDSTVFKININCIFNWIELNSYPYMKGKIWISSENKITINKNFSIDIGSKKLKFLVLSFICQQEIFYYYTIKISQEFIYLEQKFTGIFVKKSLSDIVKSIWKDSNVKSTSNIPILFCYNQSYLDFFIENSYKWALFIKFTWDNKIQIGKINELEITSEIPEFYDEINEEYSFHVKSLKIQDLTNYKLSAESSTSLPLREIHWYLYDNVSHMNDVCNMSFEDNYWQDNTLYIKYNIGFGKENKLINELPEVWSMIKYNNQKYILQIWELKGNVITTTWKKNPIKFYYEKPSIPLQIGIITKIVWNKGKAECCLASDNQSFEADLIQNTAGIEGDLKFNSYWVPSKGTKVLIQFIDNTHPIIIGCVYDKVYGTQSPWADNTVGFTMGKYTRSWSKLDSNNIDSLEKTQGNETKEITGNSTSTISKTLHIKAQNIILDCEEFTLNGTKLIEITTQKSTIKSTKNQFMGSELQIDMKNTTINSSDFIVTAQNSKFSISKCSIKSDEVQAKVLKSTLSLTELALTNIKSSISSNISKINFVSVSISSVQLAIKSTLLNAQFTTAICKFVLCNSQIAVLLITISAGIINGMGAVWNGIFGMGFLIP